MSDATTLATLQRVMERCRERVLDDRAQDPSVLAVFTLLIEELHAELLYKPPIERI